ncbi:MAG: Lipopolysaccharide assembly protein B [Syntrophus sp. SKADARSKE-3]|nr:Lipopolysaccharide assembly protein B [Syntrophus sp. SKADARSKE-3]
MAEKLTKQELKEPDKLQVLFSKAMDILMQYKKEAMIASGVVVLILVIAVGWYFYRQSEENSAMTLYNKATEAYYRARGTGQDPLVVVKLFEDVVKNYSGTQAAAFSSYRMGNIYLSRGNVDGAIKVYQEYLNNQSTDNDFRVLVYNGLGYCYEAKKDWKSALEYFEKAMNSKSGRDFESTNYQNVARAYESMNDRAKALEYYKKAAEKAKEPAMKELLNRKISSLG